jgi:Nickel responsive protein SCO4226-like
MPEFVAEQYFSRGDSAGAHRAGKAARRAAEQLTREGTPVALVRSMFIPQDETCMCIFEADSIQAVHTAAERAGLAFEHIAQAAAEPAPDAVREERRS